MYEFKGKIHKLYETKAITDRFSKREFVVESTGDRYPQYVSFEITGDRIPQLDSATEGDEVDISFTIRGREWRKPGGDVKYFTTLDVGHVKLTKRGGAAEGMEGRTPAAADDGEIPF